MKMSNSRAAKTVNTWAGFISMLPLFSATLVMRIVDSSLSLLLILSTLWYESFTLYYIHICVSLCILTLMLKHSLSSNYVYPMRFAIGYLMIDYHFYF